MTVYGYARVSTDDQKLDGQLADLKAAGATVIMREKISGVQAVRPQLAKLLKALQAGDTVLVTKLDRLGRSTHELLDLLKLFDEKKVGFKSTSKSDAHWDTTTPQGKLLGTMLAAIAEFERSLIVQRTSEGRKRAMAEGVKFGRKPKLTPVQQREAIKRRDAGERLAVIAASYNVDPSMISRLKAA